MTATLDFQLVDGVYMSPGRPDGRCAQGHEMRPENVVFKRGEGRVRCRSCQQAANRRATARKRRALVLGLPAVGPSDREAEMLEETVEAVRHRPRTPRWGAQAACGTADPNLFVEASESESASVGGDPTRLPRIREAMAICRRCPVRSECDATAMSGRDAPPTGVVGSRYWGSREGRAQVRRAQRAAVLLAQEDER